LKIPALIMAGGKGTRMGLPVEKPLAPFLGKPLINWVVNAVKSAKNISGMYIVTSPNVPETERKCAKEGLRILKTDGKSYHDDLKQAMLKGGFQGPVLIMPSDVPALTGDVLDRIVAAYEKNGKDALAVFVPIEKRQELGLSISSTDEYKGVWYAVSGVNIINAKRILFEGKIETGAIVTDEVEVLLNVNTLEDLQIAERIMREKRN
jgi:adenosylcobinamide-phosphate guanylyltransferase